MTEIVRRKEMGRMTREEWLARAVNLVAPHFMTTAGIDIPDVRVSVGWPGGRGKKNNVIGQCWSGNAAADGVAQIFISPTIGDPVQVLGTLIHEIVHAAVGTEHGHKAPFAKVAKAVGLTGKMTSTTVGPELQGMLEDRIVPVLGDYPHAILTPAMAGVKKQTTRMLKVECPDTGYTARLTRKWIEEWGTPICPCCNEQMEMG